jgi:hypothetical protein
MSGDYVPEEGKLVSVQDAVLEKERIAALNAPRRWNVAGPFNAFNEALDLANHPPVSQAGEFFVVYAERAVFAFWFS